MNETTYINANGNYVPPPIEPWIWKKFNKDWPKMVEYTLKRERRTADQLARKGVQVAKVTARVAHLEEEMRRIIHSIKHGY